MKLFNNPQETRVALSDVEAAIDNLDSVKSGPSVVQKHEARLRESRRRGTRGTEIEIAPTGKPSSRLGITSEKAAIMELIDKTFTER